MSTSLAFYGVFYNCRDQTIAESRHPLPRPDYSPPPRHRVRRDPPLQTSDRVRVLPPSEDAHRRTYRVDPNFTNEYFW